MNSDLAPDGTAGSDGRVPDIFRGGDSQPGQPSAITVDLASQTRADRLDLSALISIFRRRLLMFSTILALCTMIAFLITAWMPEEYTANADIVLQANTDTITPGSTEVDDQPQRAEEIETELQYLKSRNLAAKVFRQLGLAGDAGFMAQVSAGNGQSVIDAATNTLTQSLDVKRIGTAYALRVSYSDGSAERAARIANGYARLFAEDRVASKVAVNETAIRILKSRMEELRGQAQKDFGALQAYRIRNNLQTKSGTSLTEQEVSSYNQQVAIARAAAAEDASRLAVARTQSRGGSSQVGAAASSPIVNALRAQRAQISARLMDLSSRYLDTHPEVVAAREQLDDIDGQIAVEVRRSVSALEVDAQASGGKLSSLMASLNKATGTLSSNNAALVAMDDLERRAQASQDLYESYLNRYKEAVAKSGAEQPNSAILSPALVPKGPSSPNLPLNLILGFLVGGLLGSTASIIAEGGFAGLTTGEDIERRIGIRYLGSIPLAESIMPNSGSALETIQDHPGGLLAESVRGVLTSLRQARSGRNQVYAVTSALPGEGKTTIVMALAQIADASGQRVAVIDCDVVRRSMSAQHGPQTETPGLREYIEGTFSVEQIKQPLFDGASLIPITTRFGKGERLLQGGKLHRLVAKLREDFDLIILDCAPVLPIAETREIVAIADNVIMVTRWRATNERAVRAAIKLLPLQAIDDLGAVLNGVDMRKRVRFGGADSDAFYKSYKTYFQD